ncbi:MAG: macro domain-containing protein [Verrucomicrobiales bacterium]|nr:macro domain-containing protein [Verrucomicrobiales bacterium]
MIEFTQGNLLEAPVEALVNTVNTVGVMGKGIALMFKERFPENYQTYAAACKEQQVEVGRMHITAGVELDGPRWIINFPTKQHWRSPTQLKWVQDGLQDLRAFILKENIKSIALPPLGCGNGGLGWDMVKQEILTALEGLSETRILIYEPTKKYQNVAKKQGVEKLTPARALIVELIRRYWVLGIDCTILEVQKLAWFLERELAKIKQEKVLNLQFQADIYGPYAPRLSHLLNSLDGSYLRCDKRIPDAKPTDTIGLNVAMQEKVTLYLSTQCKELLPALEATDQLIDGFQSPLGLEALATIDWLLVREKKEPTLEAIREGLAGWPGGSSSGARKQRIFSDKLINLTLQRLT